MERGPASGTASRLRVLHVVASRSRRGAETFAADLMRHLAATGVDQAVAVLHPESKPQIDYPVPELAVPQWRSANTPQPSWGATRRLGRLAAAWAPDVIQAHGGEALKRCVLARLSRSIPVVYRRIGSNEEWKAATPRRVAYARLVRRAARVVAVSEVVRAESIRLFGLGPEHVLTIPNGVDPARTRSTRERTEVLNDLGVPSSARVVLFLGALTAEKDPLTAIDVARGVLSRDARAWVVIAGDGPLKRQVEASVAAAPHGARFVLLENQPRVGELLNAADVLMVTSRTEGMPAVAIEAGMAGLPVAAFALAGVPEVVVDDVTGLLYAPGATDEMATGIVGLLHDSSRRRSMARAAQSRCLERFSIGPLAASYRDLYEELAASGARAW